ncbi:MAG: cytidine deaminase [Firmicutes bacterium]|nr:cytidine deaminase [Bacillota bacterium]
MKNQIFEKLVKLIENASSRYYNYPVVAILECSDGSCFSGVNVETSSPDAGICAERCALFSAIANGYKKEDFKRFYILNKTDNIITPCFICRQALHDYCPDDLEIVSFNIEGDNKTYSLKELCPNAFEESDLL